VLALLLACVGCRVHFDERADPCAAVPGLVAYFPMEQGDIAGTVLRDRSGNSHDGLIVGNPAPVLSPGMIGDSLDFAATSTAYVDVAGLPLDDSDGAAVTVAAWFSHAGPSPDEVLFDFPPPDVLPRYDLWALNDKLCINTHLGECWGIAGAYSDRWVHVAAIFRNGLETTSELYVDGVAVAMTCLQTPCTASRTFANPLRLGAADYYAYHSTLDEVRLYDRALDPGEIAMVAAACE
jgi:hypothetical protein